MLVSRLLFALLFDTLCGSSLLLLFLLPSVCPLFYPLCGSSNHSSRSCSLSLLTSRKHLSVLLRSCLSITPCVTISWRSMNCMLANCSLVYCTLHTCCAWFAGLTNTTPPIRRIFVHVAVPLWWIGLSTDATMHRVFCFSLRAYVPPKLSSCSRCFGHVTHGQWAHLDADIHALIDQSACLVEPRTCDWHTKCSRLTVLAPCSSGTVLSLTLRDLDLLLGDLFLSSHSFSTHPDDLMIGSCLEASSFSRDLRPLFVTVGLFCNLLIRSVIGSYASAAVYLGSAECFSRPICQLGGPSHQC